jgi:hypothetical protein
MAGVAKALPVAGLVPEIRSLANGHHVVGVVRLVNPAAVPAREGVGDQNRLSPHSMLF